MSEISKATIEGTTVSLFEETREASQVGPFLIHKGFQYAWQKWAITVANGLLIGHYRTKRDAVKAAEAILANTPAHIDWSKPPETLDSETRISMIVAVKEAGAEFA